MSANYRPPTSSDSDSDYDGYYGDKVKERTSYYPALATKEAQMATAVYDGDLETLKALMEEINWDIKKIMENDFTLLQLAAVYAEADIVRYLVVDCHAHVNFTRKNLPPLLLVCQSAHKPQEILLKVVRILIENGASMRATDQYQTTGLMFAAEKGYDLIMRYWVAQGGDVDARDCNGDTALFYAIEHNQVEAVRVLLELGANASIVNYKEYTPMQVAQFYGFSDVLDILPQPAQTYMVPFHFTTYNTLRDYIPQIFLKSDCPEYFQEVADILSSGRRLNYLSKFGKAGISLEKFLTINEQQLKEIGFSLPVQRMVIRRIILRFFLGHWQKEKQQAENFTKALSDNNFHNILLMAASQLRQLVVLRCTMRYIRQNMQQELFGKIRAEDVQLFQKGLMHYENSIKEAQTHAAYLASFSPRQNPLYIDYDEFLLRQKREKLIRGTFKKTMLIVGISVIVFIRLRKLFN